jgi:hypothetical protein
MNREQTLRAYAMPSEGMKHQEQRGFRSGMKRLLDLEENNLWFLAGLVVLIAAVIIGWRILSQPGPGEAQTGQTDAASRRAIESLIKQVAGLNERVAMLTDSINDLQSKLTRAHVLTDPSVTAEGGLPSSITREQTAMAEPERVIATLPPPAAGQYGGNASLAQASGSRTNSAAAVQPGAGNVVPTATGTAALGGDHASVAQKRPAGRVGTGGPWVINLVSSLRKADADRFAEKAHSRDIRTEQQRVTIKGQQYWRVQITGFATAEGARAYAGTARDKLGLKDVWITRR